MDHSTVISKLEELLPEIKKTRDPESVLLKYACKENLAPAQLEKFAQVYNTAKKLSFLEKSSNRGGSFRLVETESLLDRYQGLVPEEPRTGKLESWVDFPTAKAAYEFPDLTKLEEEEVKAASQEVLEPQPSLHQLGLERDLLHEFIAERTEDARELFGKAAARLKNEALPFNEVEQDAVDILGSEAKEVMDKLASYIGRELPRYQGDNTPRLARDRHNFLPVISQAQDALEQIKAAKSCLEDLDTSIKAAVAVASEPEADKDQGNVDNIINSVRNSGRRNHPKSDASRYQSKSKRTPLDQIVIDIPESGGNHEKGKPSSSPMEEILAAIDKRLSGADPIGYFRENTGPALVEALKSDTNKAQKSLDQEHDDHVFLTAAQRLLTTDSYISQHDPQKAMAIMNSIRASSPDAARDINVLRYATREGLQYGGVPLHTYKDLLTMQELRGKAMETERRHQKETYSNA